MENCFIRLFFGCEQEPKTNIWYNGCNVQSFETHRRLAYTYWSFFSGKTDTPKNYANIGFEVVGHNDKCCVTGRGTIIKKAMPSDS